jgi:hypothetical protein
MSVITTDGVTDVTIVTDQPEPIAPPAPPVRLSQVDGIADYGSALPVTAFTVDRDNPHFLPLRDKDGKTVKYPDGRAQLSSEYATDANMSSSILQVLRTVRMAASDADGCHVLSSGGVFNLSVKAHGKVTTASVRLVSITANKREKAENATVFYAVRTASGYVRDSLPIRLIHAVSGNR